MLTPTALVLSLLLGAEAPDAPAPGSPAPGELAALVERLHGCTSGCDLKPGVGCISPQACTLWTIEGALTAAVPAGPSARHAETWACGDAVAGVMLYEFRSPAEAKQALGFAEGYVWGESRATPRHPEAVFLEGNILVVVSARKPKALAACLKGPKK